MKVFVVTLKKSTTHFYIFITSFNNTKLTAELVLKQQRSDLAQHFCKAECLRRPFTSLAEMILKLPTSLHDCLSTRINIKQLVQ